MNFRRLAKLPQHKRFDFQPRFYDEDKEKREQRQRWQEAEQRIKDEEVAQNHVVEEPEQDIFEHSEIRGSFGRAKEKRKTLFGNMSIAVLAVVLFGGIYVFRNLGTTGVEFSWQLYVVIFAIAVYVLLRIRANAKK